MEVKKGYKKTEIGIIPSDWNLITYGKAFDFLSTATYSRDQLSDKGEVGYVHYGDIHTKWNHFLDFNTGTMPSIEGNQVKNFSLIKNGDLIMADASEDYSGLGKCVEVKNIGRKKVISGLHTFLLRDKANAFVSGFKAYIHSCTLVKNQFDKLATGMKVYSVSKNNLRSIYIPLPPEREQSAIASALGDIDALLISLKKLISKKRRIKETTSRSLMRGKKRLPGYNGKWNEVDFSKVCWFQEGPGLRQWQFKKEGIKVINVTNLENGYLNLERTDRYISWDEFNKMYKHFEINDKDILVASSGNTYCKTAVVRSRNLPLVMNTSVIRFKPLKGMDYGFLFEFLKSNLFKDQIDLLITGGAQPNFGPVHLKMIKIKLPPLLDEQIEIAKILKDFDYEIEQLEQKLSKYKVMKQGMIQELLTGKRRLYE